MNPATETRELSLIEILSTMLVGLKATVKEAGKPEFTEFYPEQRPDLPWGTKGQLYVDVTDCISCFRCAKACPSDCIRIDCVRAPAGTLADTTDGHKRTYDVIRFDIDMAQCCYCGLCTGRSSYVPPEKKNDPAALAAADRIAACPTDCINFYPRYENGSEDATNMIYHFATYTFEDAKARWNSLAPDKKRSTHLDRTADYAAGSAAAVAAPPAPAPARAQATTEAAPSPPPASSQPPARIGEKIEP